MRDGGGSGGTGGGGDAAGRAGQGARLGLGARFIESHYTNAKSKQRALNAWAPVLAFLEWRKDRQAAMVTYAHGHGMWRGAVAPKECRLKPRAKNTALTELKLFGVALQQQG